MVSTSVALYLAGILFQSGAADKPVLDNDRATVWDTSAKKTYTHEYVAITLSDGAAKFGHKGSAWPARGRTVVVEIKDHAPTALPNKSGFPNAFPRPGSKKVLESDKVIVWDYSWAPGVPTPMHFHDKEVVVTYLKDGSLKSTTPAGENTVNDYTFGTVRFNPPNRIHQETLVKGNQRAIIVEFK